MTLAPVELCSERSFSGPFDVLAAAPLLSVRGLSKRFGGVTAVDGLEFDIASGSVYSLIGPNGAGKTTVFNLITGVVRPTSGDVGLSGEPIAGLPQYQIALRGVARTFQNLQIFFNMGAVENVMIGSSRFLDRNPLRSILRSPSIVKADRECRSRAKELMLRVGLERYVGCSTEVMPYGALKRLEIARALASQPKILFLDEPAAGLTAIERLQIVELIRTISSDPEGPTIIIVEHDMKLVMDVSDQVLVLANGRKLAQGTPSEVQANPAVVDAYLGAIDDGKQ